jgi:PDZ domain-containing protein
MMRPTPPHSIVFLLVAALCSPASLLHAENVVEVPVLAAIRTNDRGVFEVMLVWWDQKPDPQPMALQWRYGGVLLKETHLGAMAAAFRYAIERTPGVSHTGTVSVQGVAYVPTSADGPSAGAAMAVGFIAVLKGDSIRRGVALTGTLAPDGHIGPVGMIPDKIRAAAREGYRTVLMPVGQLNDPRWRLGELGLELNTGRRL